MPQAQVLAALVFLFHYASPQSAGVQTQLCLTLLFGPVEDRRFLSVTPL